MHGNNPYLCDSCGDQVVHLPLKKSFMAADQCDQKKIAKFLQNLPKNNFTRKMIDFDTFTKIP